MTLAALPFVLLPREITTFANQPIFLAATLSDAEDNLIKAEDIESVHLHIKDVISGQVSSPEIEVDVLDDTAIENNFLYELDGDDIPLGNHTYFITFLFITSELSNIVNFPLQWRINTLGLGQE